jgi:hypothetical protein
VIDTNSCGALHLALHYHMIDKFATTLVITVPSRGQTPKTWRPHA